MSGGIVALCDTEEEYAQHMTSFLKGHREVAWEVYTYTEVDGLLEFLQSNPVKLLVIAENAYGEEVRSLAGIPTVLLNESGVVRWQSVRNVNKYQRAEKVFQEIVQEFAETAGELPAMLHTEGRTKLIGMYSPVRRCLQTSFALTLGQMLALEHRTLYLNFEHYAGITELVPDIQTRDLADLLYFLSADGDRFLLRLETILGKKGELDYVPPMKAGQNLILVTAREWRRLLDKIAGLGTYDYIILDLTENIQGLFDILRSCSRIFTLTKEDPAARCKLNQYEHLLTLCEYQDVLDRTRKLKLPRFCGLTQQIEQFTKGDLADYVRGLIKEELA